MYVHVHIFSSRVCASAKVELTVNEGLYFSLSGSMLDPAVSASPVMWWFCVAALVAAGQAGQTRPAAGSAMARCTATDRRVHHLRAHRCGRGAMPARPAAHVAARGRTPGLHRPRSSGPPLRRREPRGVADRRVATLGT